MRLSIFFENIEKITFSIILLRFFYWIMQTEAKLNFCAGIFHINPLHFARTIIFYPHSAMIKLFSSVLLTEESSAKLNYLRKFHTNQLQNSQGYSSKRRAYTNIERFIILSVWFCLFYMFLQHIYIANLMECRC